MILFLLAGAVVITCVAIHLVVLEVLKSGVRRLKRFPRFAVGAVIFGAIIGHLIEIEVFALTYYGVAKWADMGELIGEFTISHKDYHYFSAVTYTTLGFGDITPRGELRWIAAIEALTGLVLITWTASFAFLVMQELWSDKSSS